MKANTHLSKWLSIMEYEYEAKQARGFFFTASAKESINLCFLPQNI